MHMGVTRRVLRLKRPLRSSYGGVRERELFTVALSDGEGPTGYGEAAPLEPYDGVSAQRVHEALESYRPVLMQSDGSTGAQLVDACRRVCDEPVALAAIDLALWDRAGRRAGRPVAALLTDAPAAEVTVNATLSATDRAGAAAQAAEAAGRGYECVKVKVGLGDDAGRVAAVRAAAGPRVALRVDANGAWDVAEAVRAIDALAPVGLELVEEPTHGLEAVRAIRERVAARIAIDETAAEHGALGAGVADAVCLKISRCGGIAGLLAAATLVRASGAEVYLASTLDGPLGIAAAVHAAAALASRGPLPACGLATLGLFEDVEDPLPVRRGRIAVPLGGGLGVDPQIAPR
jgi:L-Ala-D/L-Glu epimerase